MTESMLAQKNKGDLSSDEYYELAKIEGNKKGNFKEAANYSKLGLQKSPNNTDIREYLGKCYLELKKYDSARFELKKVTDKNRNAVDARHYLVNIEYSTGRYSSAICYINELLEIRPYSKTLWLKKIAIYNEMGNKIEAKRALTRLYQIFPQDSMVKRYYRNVISEEADKYAKTGDYRSTKELYDKVLTIEPTDLQTIQKQVNLELKSGKKTNALELIETGLASYPYDPILVMKKIGLLQEMHQYPEAITYIETLQKKYNSPTLRKVLTDIKSESARYYNNTDPYVLYQKVYEANPGNEEAYTYLLNNSISKGYYDDAAMYLKIGLKRNPNNKQLLLKQLSLFESQNRTAEANKLIEKIATKFPGETDVREKYNTILFNQAKGYFQDALYSQALPAFEKLSRVADYSKDAQDYIYSIYVAQKDYPKALNQINKLIGRSSKNEEYLFKKSGLLEEMGRYDEAMEVTNTLARRFPNNPRYKSVYSSQSIPYIKLLLENEKYDSVEIVVESVLEKEPMNVLAFNYGINASATKKDYSKAIDYCDRAIAVLPDSKEFRLKKAGLYSEMKDKPRAIQELSNLQVLYPYNEKIKGSLAEELLIQGKQFEKDGKVDSAFTYYANSYKLNPTDTFALYRLINIELENNALEIARFYAEEGLNKFPDNQTLLLKKGVIYEKLQEFDSAYHYLKLAEPPYGFNKTFSNYLDYLYAKRYKNQIGINFIRAFFDSTQLKSAIATLEYTRFEKRNTYTVRFNYAARPIGTGVQTELEWFHKLNKKYYTQANLAAANQFVFPKFRVSGSVFSAFKNNYEGELGFRHILQRNNVNLTTLVGGVAKEWGDVWVNMRAFVMSDYSKFYQALTLQSRYYLNYRNDFFTIMGSIGTPPEDKTLDFQLNTFLTYVTRMVGAGYQHKIKHRTTLGIQGNWFNFRIKSDYNVNQYNLFISLLTMF